MQYLVVDDERLFQCGQTTLGDRDRDVGILEAGQQQHEFVTSPPSQRVAIADAGLERGSDQLEQSVTHAMAESVTDILEAVDVDHQHRQERALPPSLREPVREAFVEQKAVWERRQMVRSREIVQ